MSSPKHYFTPDYPIKAEIRVKDSRFIAHLHPAADLPAVENILRTISTKYADATHHCYAYRIGIGEQLIYRSDDAGEPAGSAGKPILQALQTRMVSNAVLVVSRYFGGTKLGIGGLIRAYSTAAFAALDAASLRPMILLSELVITFDYQDTGLVHHTVQQFNGQIIETSFTPQPVIRIELPRDHVSDFQQILTNRTRGRVSIISKN